MLVRISAHGYVFVLLMSFSDECSCGMALVLLMAYNRRFCDGDVDSYGALMLNDFQVRSFRREVFDFGFTLDDHSPSLQRSDDGVPEYIVPVRLPRCYVAVCAGKCVPCCSACFRAAKRANPGQVSVGDWQS